MLLEACWKVSINALDFKIGSTRYIRVYVCIIMYIICIYVYIGISATLTINSPHLQIRSTPFFPC